MSLSWNEVRARAAKFADDWQDASYEKGECQSFYNDFFEVFGVQRRSVARYEQHVQKLDNRAGWIDLFWPGVLIVEQKSEGRDLSKAYEQAGEYFDALPERQRPRYILVSDFQTFELHDLDERETASFKLRELPDEVQKFGFIRGVQQRTFRDQDPVNIEAGEIVGHLHDLLAEAGYEGHDLERFLVRIVFCLFADDTGIFEPRDIFLDFIERRTSEDGADLGPWLAQLFQVMDTPVPKRAGTLDEDLAQFPYVNGDLFEGALRIPSFNTSMRQELIEACMFDWSKISPAIFGSLFQSVMDPEERRAQGAHYTTEKNILKVIEPLFMDDLRSEFETLKRRRDRGRRNALRTFQEKLSDLKLFDPACGCGNFLIIAYRELRTLEMEVIRELGEIQFSRIDVDQFYGIEIGEFAARIAETALWMMDHIMNNRLTLQLGQSYARIPLETAPNIVQADALEMDWSGLLPPEECSFVFGNPPFVGAKLQTKEQRAQVRRIADLGGSGGTLDYVTAWYIKAGQYIANGSARIGFVATNSITQGEQVAQLWSVLFGRLKLELSFAHRTFAWGSDARGKAHVHVVILGLDIASRPPENRRLFSYPDINGEPEESEHVALSPYLIDAGGLKDAQLTVREESRPINGFARLIIGSQPIDNGLYIFNAEQRAAFLELEPEAEEFLRPFVGSREYLQGGDRWILILHEATPEVLSGLPLVRERISAVRIFRERSKRRSTRLLAQTPTSFQVNVIPKTPYLAVPETSSERREYVPIGWLEPPTVPSNAIRILTNADLLDFALLTSSMHMAWLRYVGGRLESRYRYSIGLVYNTFPTPLDLEERHSVVARLRRLAQQVLDLRARHSNATLAQLYDPDLMPTELRHAHRSLDSAVDKLYKKTSFKSERERIEHLLVRYEQMLTPLDPVPKKRRKRRRST